MGWKDSLVVKSTAEDLDYISSMMKADNHLQPQFLGI